MKKLVTLIIAFALVFSVMTPVLSAAGASDFKAVSGDGRVKLTWESDGSGEYDVLWRRASSDEWKTAITTKKTAVTVKGLRNGVEYAFCLRSSSGLSPVIKITPSATGSKTVSAVYESTSGFETAADAVKNMGAGYNIGNTFDSMGTWLPKNASVKSHETAWGNPQITEKLITTLADQGFGAIRLPVTWNFNSDENGNIRKEWLDRVEEVVGWILDSGMYCIINVHHDTGADGWIHASKSNFDKNKKRFENIWKQVAVRFKDYGEKLVFECMNETLNDANDWNATDAASREYIKKYQQVFIDTVRKSGGNNAERNLVVSTYAASSNPAIINAFTLPDDSAEDHLILEVHNYDPQGFTWKNASWTTPRTTWGTDQDKKDIDNFMSVLAKKAKALGVPAIVGEFGSEDKNNDAERAKHAAYFVKSATAQGIRCFYWDDGGNYILINRSTAKILRPDIMKALVENAK